MWLLVIEGADQIVVMYKISTGAAPKVLTNEFVVIFYIFLETRSHDGAIIDLND